MKTRLHSIKTALGLVLLAGILPASAQFTAFEGGEFGAGTSILAGQNKALYDTPLLWTHNKTGQWSITSEALVGAGVASNRRMAARSGLTGLTGTGWQFQFDVTSFTSGSLNYLKLWLGTEDGDNVAGDELITTGGDPSSPSPGIVDGDGWTTVLDLNATQLATIASTGTFSYPLTGVNFDDYDIAVLSFSGGGSSGNFFGTIDNFGFSPAAVVVDPPVADFSADSSGGVAPLTVNFTDLSTNLPTSWSWDLDGDTVEDSTDQHPSFEYTAAGTYTVTLTATNAQGSDAEVKTNLITITLPDPPVADFSATPLIGPEGTEVSFSDLSTNNPTSWSWDLDGDTVEDSTAENPSFTYNTAGTYTVTLTATNLGGSSAPEVKTGYITIDPLVIPTADFEGCTTSDYGPYTVNFTDLSTDYPDTWSWDLDGDTVEDSTDQNPSFTYTTPGTYTVTLVASNGAGSSPAETKVGYITVTGFPTSGSLALIHGGDLSCDPIDENNSLYHRNRLEAGWVGNKPNWTVESGALTGASAGSTSRVGKAIDLTPYTGTGWNFQFDSAITSGSLIELTIWAGTDDGNNSDTTQVMSLGGTTAEPESGVVTGDTWTKIVELTTAELDAIGTGTNAFAVPFDLSNYDFAVMRLRGGGNLGAVTGTLDNFGFIVAPAPAPEIAVEEPASSDIPSGGSRDFGVVPLGDSAQLTFTVKNTGNSLLSLDGTPPDYVVVGGTHPDDFTVSTQPSNPVSAGGSTTFTVDFATTAVGLRSATLTIANNDGDEAPFTINVTGTGVAVPEIGVDQPFGSGIGNGGSRDFGTTDLGSSTSLTFTIQNFGTTDLTLDGTAPNFVVVGGADPGDFTVTAQPSTPVPASGNTDFTVEFSPAATGVRSATLTIDNNDGDEDPFVITVTGTGTGAPPGSPYVTWSGGEPFDGDKNGDGIDNGLAFLLGAGNPDDDATGLLPTGHEDGFGGLVLSFSMRNAANRGDADLSVQHSGDLGVLDPWTTVLVPDVSGGPTDGVTFAVTVGEPLNTVEATISSGESIGSSLFGRLKGTDE